MGGNGRCTSSECLCLETASRGFHLALVMNILIIFTRLRAITVLRRATRLYLATRTVETIFSGCQWSEQKCPNLLRAGMPDDPWIYILSIIYSKRSICVTYSFSRRFPSVTQHRQR